MTLVVLIPALAETLMKAHTNIPGSVMTSASRFSVEH